MPDVGALTRDENSTYEDWFEPPPVSEKPHSVIADAEQYVARTRIDNHEFFRYAAGSRYALIIWVTQELTVTGPFAQCMLYVASLLRNVHSRSRMTAVAWGEHSPVRDGVARGAHPWLLHQLRESMGISRRDVHTLPMTEEFLRHLRSTCADPLRGVAAIGVGNEQLIVPEYNAVKSAFAAAFPTCAYEPFLDANISEDGHHARLLQEVAACLIAEGGDPLAYLEAARLSVDSRVTYYDRLLEWVGQCGEEIVETSGSVLAMAPRRGG